MLRSAWEVDLSESRLFEDRDRGLREGFGGGRRRERCWKVCLRQLPGSGRVAKGEGCACLLQLGAGLGLLGWLHVARSDFPLRRRAGGG